MEQVKRKLKTFSFWPASMIDKMTNKEIYLDQMASDYLMYEASRILETHEIPEKNDVKSV